jgi:hypothetical protein
MRWPQPRLLPAIPLGRMVGNNQVRGAKVLLFLVEVKQITGIYFESAGELKNIVETDVLFSAFHFADKITVHLDHLA